MDSQQQTKGTGRLDFERLRRAQLRLDWSGGAGGSDALPSLLGRVVTTEASIKVGGFCKVIPSVVLGVEQEGSAGIFADSATVSSSGTNPSTVFVYLLGSFVPMPGDYLICRFVDHRWVAETTGGGKSHGGGGISLPSCFCEVPPVLQMISADPKCNYGMFQSCSIQYGPPPAAMAGLGFSKNVFTSPQSFYDPISKSNFFYYFSCQYNQFYLTRVYPTSPFGSPYRDGILYSWVVGGYGNACNPFQLSNGMAYPGSDSTCSVSISGS